MGSRIITILCAALLAGGCATGKKASHSITQPQTPPTVQQEVRRDEPRPERERNARAESRQQQEQVPATTDAPRPARPVIHFSDAETQHVRLSTINYFPLGGIDLSFDELAAEFCYPVCGNLISDYGMRRGRMHTGIDIKAALCDTIRAAFPGVVRMSKNYSGYGNIIVIRHYQGFETAYSHNYKNLVKPNDVVEAGDPIALAGRTGTATTEHLHFEVRAGGEHIDPKLVVDPSGRKLRTGRLFIRNNHGSVVASATESGAQQAGEDAVAEKAEHDAARAQALAESTVNGHPKAPAEPEPVYYRVRKGDTLSGIAQKHGTTVTKLCELSKIKKTALLQINQRLRVQ